MLGITFGNWAICQEDGGRVTRNQGIILFMCKAVFLHQVRTFGTHLSLVPYCQVVETVNLCSTGHLSQFPPTSDKCDKRQTNHQSLFIY